MRTRYAGVATLLIFLGTGCGQELPPVAPSPTPSRPTGFPDPVPVPPIPGASRAVVSISDLRITAVPTANNGSYKFGYLVRFALVETSGLSGATIQGVETDVEGGDRFNTGGSCWRETFRVAPGGTLTAFSGESLGYCAPDAASPAPASRFTVVVTFTDDEGHSGMTSVTGSVTP